MSSMLFEILVPFQQNDCTQGNSKSLLERALCPVHVYSFSSRGTRDESSLPLTHPEWDRSTTHPYSPLSSRGMPSVRGDAMSSLLCASVWDKMTDQFDPLPELSVSQFQTTDFRARPHLWSSAMYKSKLRVKIKMLVVNSNQSAIRGSLLKETTSK